MKMELFLNSESTVMLDRLVSYILDTEDEGTEVAKWAGVLADEISSQVEVD